MPDDDDDAVESSLAAAFAADELNESTATPVASGSGAVEELVVGMKFERLVAAPLGLRPPWERIPAATFSAAPMLMLSAVGSDAVGRTA